MIGAATRFVIQITVAEGVLLVLLWVWASAPQGSAFKRVTKILLIGTFFCFSAFLAVGVHQDIVSWLGYVFFIAPAILWAVSSLLLGSFTVTRAAEFHQPPEAIWQVIVDVKKWNYWRRNCGITSLPPRDGRPAWLQKFEHTYAMRPLTWEMDEMIPNERMVTRLVDPNRRMQCTWSFEISPTSSGSRLRITEHGKIDGAINRIAESVVLPFLGMGVGHRKTITHYLEDLGQKFGEHVAVAD